MNTHPCTERWRASARGLLAAFVARAALPCLLAFSAFAASPPAAAADTAFLEPEQAFQVQVAGDASGAVTVTLTSAPGYHLYRERFELKPQVPTGLAAAELPAGRLKYDANFGREMALWDGSVTVRQPLPATVQKGQLAMSYQGCAEAGLCYPPQRGTVAWQRDGSGTTTALWQPAVDEPLAPSPPADSAVVAPAVSGTLPSQLASASRAAPPSANTDGSNGSNDASDAALRSGSLVKVLGMFLLGGLLLSFTPCVLPMLPILSSIIVGQGETVSRGKGFGLAGAYSLGMALVYTAAGVVAGLLGSGFAAALQNPWVLGSFAAMLCLLSLSMFGVWEFQMPGFIQERVNNASNRLSGGRHLAVFAMGGLSALLVGPCVAAPLAGALLYISQTRDVVLGGAALFALAVGMSVPLLLLGLSAGSLLPRAGRWMEHVKTFFGVLLLCVALWLVSPVLPIEAVMALAGGGALVLLVALGAFERGRARLVRGLGLVVGLLAVAQLAGALSGGGSLLQPLAHLAARSNGGAGAPAAGAGGPARFQRITRLEELDAALASAGRPVMVDFYADWCVACKEMEHLTFKDPAIKGRMDGALLLQADVTADTPDAKALMRRYGLFGPPAVLFFDAGGQELRAARTIGYEDPSAFSRRLDAARL